MSRLSSSYHWSQGGFVTRFLDQILTVPSQKHTQCLRRLENWPTVGNEFRLIAARPSQPLRIVGGLGFRQMVKVSEHAELEAYFAAIAKHGVARLGMFLP